MVEKAIAASKDWSSNGRPSAVAATHGAASAGRCARMTADGSTAVTSRSEGSYEPVPAPTFNTVRASPSAAPTCAAIRGSVRRVTVYVAPMVSYNCALDIDPALHKRGKRWTAGAYLVLRAGFGGGGG